MTELLGTAITVRTTPDGRLQALRLPHGWRAVVRVANQWVVDSDWWRLPVRRHYMRLLLGGGECVEVYRDLGDGTWHLARRYD